MTLLATLDTVAWDELGHAYGPATDVPDLLRALVWPDRATAAITKAAGAKSVREHVIWSLWGNVFHQGTRWQVTPHVIPFLVEILSDGPREADLQEFLLGYLHHLAFGYPLDEFPQLVDLATYFADADAPPEDPDDPFDHVAMCGYARDCYRNVEAALPVIARFATHETDSVARAAIALLGSFRSAAAVTGLRRVVVEQEGRRLAIALVALAQLDRDAIRAKAEALLDDDDRYTAVHAAAALALASADLPAKAIDVLTSPLGDLTEEDSPMTGTLGRLVGACLARLPASHIERAVDAIGSTLASANALTNLSATGSLLRLAFGEDGQAPASAAQLTAIQRKALDYIAEHGGFEWNGAQFGNYDSLLKGWGFPGKRDELRAWLTQR